MTDAVRFRPKVRVAAAVRGKVPGWAEQACPPKTVALSGIGVLGEPLSHGSKHGGSLVSATDRVSRHGLRNIAGQPDIASRLEVRLSELRVARRVLVDCFSPTSPVPG